MRLVALMVLCGGCLGADQTVNQTLSLGYLYIHSDSSWVVESFSQFVLAIRHINADPSILPRHKLTFSAYDTRGSQDYALAGAIQLLSDPTLIGLVGTGYSSAAAAPAIYASLMNKPMISPGSTDLSLADKEHFPFFLRNIASGEPFALSLAAFVDEQGWQNTAILATQTGFTEQASLLYTQSLRARVAVYVTFPETDSNSYQDSFMVSRVAGNGD